MTLVAEAMNRSLVTIDLGLSLGEAAGVLRRTGAEHLVVVDGDKVVGILCGCELRGAPLERPVSERKILSVPSIRPDVAIEEAAATMAGCQVDCVPVTVGGLLLGTLSEAELRKAGVDPIPPRAGVPPHRHRRRSRAEYG